MPVRAVEVILSDEADAAATSLDRSRSKESTSITRRIEYYRQRLVEDCLAGEVIPFPLPKTARPLETRHAPLENLYCLDLPAFWRMLYTIVRADGRPYVYVLEIVEHTQYSKWFPGNRKH
jgi:hypothetical protein